MRGLALVLASFLLNVIVVGVAPLFGTTGVRPEMPLVVAVWVGLATARRRLASAKESVLVTTLIGLGVGYLGDLVAGAPVGLGALACVLAALVARALAERLLVGAWWRVSLLTLLFALFHGIVLILVGGPVFEGLFGRLARAWLLSSLASAVVAPLAFVVLDWLDGLVDRRALDSSIIHNRQRGLS